MKTLILAISCVPLFLATLGFFKWREERMIRERGTYSLQQFLNHFSNQAVPERILLEVYRYFQSLQATKDFPVHPEDDLYQVYGVWNEDLDDAVMELAQKCGCKAPTNDSVKGINRVQSIEDIVRLLAQLCS